MDITDFIKHFADQFEDVDVSEINTSTRFQEFEEWGSLAALQIIAFARTEYGKKVTALDIRACNTVGELFNLIQNK